MCNRIAYASWATEQVVVTFDRWMVQMGTGCHPRLATVERSCAGTDLCFESATPAHGLAHAMSYPTQVDAESDPQPF